MPLDIVFNLIYSNPIEMANKIQKRRSKKESTDKEQEVSESLATILKDQLGEDDDTLRLIKQLEKQDPNAEDNKKEEKIEKDRTNYRRCPNCGLDTLFVNNVCSECGYKLARNNKIAQDRYSTICEDEE